MTRIKTLLMVLLLVIGGICVYEVERREGAEKRASEAKRLVFPGLVRENISRMNVVHEGGGFSLEPREQVDGQGSKWSVKELGGLFADENSIGELFDTLVGLKAGYEIGDEELVEDVSDYGFTQPSLVVSFSDSKKDFVIYFGNKHPVSKRRYARFAGDHRVVMIDERDFLALKKNAMDLWDARPFVFEVDKVLAVFVDRKQAGPLRFFRGKQQGLWEYRGEDGYFIADTEMIEKNLRVLSQLRVSEVITPGPKMSEFGLHDPKLILGLTVESESDEPEALIVFVGEGGEENKPYCRIKGSSLVFGLKRAFYGDLLQPVGHFRDRMPFRSFSENDLERFALRTAKRERDLLLKRGESDDWVIDGKEGALKVNSGKVAEWLKALVHINVLSYPALSRKEFEKTGLDEAYWSVEFWQKGNLNSLRFCLGEAIASSEDHDSGITAPRYAGIDFGDGRIIPAVISAAVWKGLVVNEGFLMNSATEDSE